MKQHHAQPAADRNSSFHFVWIFPSKPKTFVLNGRNIFIWKNNCIFPLFYVLCIFAQGFSLNMQLLDQHIQNLTIFIRVLNLKVLKTLILDTFAGEHTIKPMDFQSFCVFLHFHTRVLIKSCTCLTILMKNDYMSDSMSSWQGGDRSKQVTP